MMSEALEETGPYEDRLEHEAVFLSDCRPPVGAGVPLSAAVTVSRLPSGGGAERSQVSTTRAALILTGITSLTHFKRNG